MNIRRAQYTDIVSLSGIEELQPFSAQWGPRGWPAELVEGISYVWCAVKEEKVVGFIAYRQTAGFCEILNVAVHPAHCQQGIAKALLAHALQEIKTQGGQTVTLEVNEYNVPAQALYRQAGFQEVGRRKKFYRGKDDALILNYTL